MVDRNEDKGNLSTVDRSHQLALTHLRQHTTPSMSLLQHPIIKAATFGEQSRPTILLTTGWCHRTLFLLVLFCFSCPFSTQLHFTFLTPPFSLMLILVMFISLCSHAHKCHRTLFLLLLFVHFSIQLHLTLLTPPFLLHAYL